MRLKLSKFRLREKNGNMGISAIFFALGLAFVVMFFLPPKLSPVPEGGCRVGVPPAKNEVLKLPAIKLDHDYSYAQGTATLHWGYQDKNDIREYELIRSHVPTARETIPPGWLMLGGPPPVSSLQHTENYGEVPEKPGYDLYYPLSSGEIDPGMTGDNYSADRHTITINDAGLIFFVNKDPNTVQQKDGKTILDVEVYQDRSKMESAYKVFSREQMFACYGNRSLEDPHLLEVGQDKSQNHEQLQLEWFFLAASNYWAIHCKPAVYLYPPKKQLVNVKVFPAGTLTYTDPLYPEGGWNVEAAPDGTLVNLGPTDFMKQFDYLYFESKVPDEVIRKPGKGWVIKSGQWTVDDGQLGNENRQVSPSPWGEGRLASLSERSGGEGSELKDWFNPLEEKFSVILPQLGLNKAQTKDFIEYWKKALPYSPYYFVGVIDQDNVDQIEKLEIAPSPDSVNRVRIYFERLDQPKNVEAPELSGQFAADSGQFKVVEWGGMVKRDKDHPFTCSQ